MEDEEETFWWVWYVLGQGDEGLEWGLLPLGSVFIVVPLLYLSSWHDSPETSIVSYRFECDLEEVPQTEALGANSQASSPLRCVTIK